MEASRTAKAGKSLAALAKETATCKRCDIWKCGGRAVFGEGALTASLMLVGEQPGDQEERAGHPFVGPAGRILDEALEAAGFDRDMVYVSNVVKHFKFEPRGKRRLHQRPTAGEIDICKWWLWQEVRLVQPRLILALGASAVRGLLGRSVAVGKSRGQIMTIGMPDAAAVPDTIPQADKLRRERDWQGALLVSIHPSFILRQRDDASRHREKQGFISDLKHARKYLA
ncbi:UdgX family uracil-DNA binding protein [Dongia soli]|uniref:Type-4 uracil-DNA glycosylase n=1 Tax=Dongia soli TaxID=600628 RepID=A0ABU5EI27_9PROT|nr:UdgX family uracil-DNA binding protein [Dongia soli]MDY0885517.1 UdgX family uracil-DNA binding protein [Dongia soli]